VGRATDEPPPLSCALKDLPACATLPHPDPPASEAVDGDEPSGELFFFAMCGHRGLAVVSQQALFPLSASQ
jgi:hypothetical protein